ncbi:MAG TPA: nucleotidyltransferase family protein [Beijerinckiaceae bacterium]|jgi:NDP-sugar pyrophosphorylase family protein
MSEALPPVVVLAGGLATRMRPMTERIPKAMIEVAGEPFVAHQLRKFAREGASRVVLCVGYLWEQIRDFVGDGAAFGLEVEYALDGPKLLGTGGAIRQALPRLGQEFIVTYGDSWLDEPYAPIADAFRQSGAPALMTVYRNEGRWDTSNVVYVDGRVIRYSKRERLPAMHYIDWGLQVMTAPVVAARPEGEAWDLAEELERLSLEGRLAGYEVKTRFYEIGSPDGLREADALLRGAPG